MDFAYTPVQQTLRQRAKNLCDELCSGQQEEQRERDRRYPQELFIRLAKDGLLSHCLPAEFGGGDGTLLDLVVLSEELARASQTAVTMMFINGACGHIINLAGTPTQKKELL